MGFSTPSVIVVGAGVVGAAGAEALAASGCRVSVLESAFAGGGATGAAMGHVVAMDDSPEQLALSSFSRRLWAERAAGLGPALEDERCGTLWVAADGEEMAHVRTRAETYASRGLAAAILDEAALREAEPCLRPGLAGALLVPDDRVVYPPGAARLLLDAARRAGADVRHGAAEAVEARRVRCGGTWLEADAVVVAAGGDSPRLVPGLPVFPRKGHLAITERAPGLLRHQVVELGYLRSAHTLTGESVAFNVQPRPTGQVLVGSSRELVGWDDSVNRPLLARMLRRATSYAPGLARLPVTRAWTGFRPATADKLPLVGRWEDGLLVATGHEGLGVTMALGTARLVADILLGRAPALDPAPFDPRRRMHARG
jgi:glycine/D-amino acid oxidase-like deaminating enzyme